MMESLEDSDSESDVPSFDFVIPLRPFERQLLEEIQRTYSSVLDHALSDLQCLDGEGVFNHWGWGNIDVL